MPNVSSYTLVPRTGSTILFSRLSKSIYEEVGGLDAQLRVNEDTDLCLKLIQCDAKCYVSRFKGAIVYKGPRNNTISKSNSLKQSYANKHNNTKKYSKGKKLLGRIPHKNNLDIKNIYSNNFNNILLGMYCL